MTEAWVRVIRDTWLWRLRAKRFHVAVLGASESGKTTLINSWSDAWTGQDPGRTQAPKNVGDLRMEAGGIRMVFTKTTDVSGALEGWPQWEPVATESRYVLYLVDARTLAAKESGRWDAGWDRLDDDAGQIGLWLAGRRGVVCLVVVTHTDQDSRFRDLGDDDYHRHVSDQLDPIILRLGGAEKVRLVIGCLENEAAAAETTAKITEHIVSLERKP